MELIKAILSLIRIRHTGQVIGIISVLSIKSQGITIQSIFAISCYLCLCIALFSFDDAHDYKSDLLAHPERVIPKGVFTTNQIYLVGTTTLFIGMLLASSLMFYQFMIYVSTAILGFIVIFVKMNSILRAIINALMIFLLFPFGISINLKSLFFGLIIAIPHIAGSITKDFLHSKGDEKIGLRPPTNFYRYVASALFFISSGTILLPILFNLVVWYYIPLIFPTFVSSLILGRKVLNRENKMVYLYGAIGMISTLVTFALNI